MNSPDTPLTLTTPRLILRPWCEADHEPFVKMSADPAVMRHFPDTLNREEAFAVIDRIQRMFDELGFGFWAVEAPGVTSFAGFVGLASPKFETHFTPCIEIGWRLAKEHWGKGYATEAAQAALQFGFERFDEIVAFTVPENRASRRVMTKLGMIHREEENFQHPSLPDGHPLKLHVLYRLQRNNWRNSLS